MPSVKKNMRYGLSTAEIGDSISTSKNPVNTHYVRALTAAFCSDFVTGTSDETFFLNISLNMHLKEIGEEAKIENNLQQR